jgi:citrate lyase beta subunit
MTVSKRLNVGKIVGQINGNMIDESVTKIAEAMLAALTILVI